MHRFKGLVVFVLLFLAMSQGVARAQAHLTARLDGAQETPVVVTPARGTAAATLTPLGLQFFVTVEGLSGPITAAHIHNGVPGLAGPAVRSILTEFAGGTTAAGLWTAADPTPLSPTLISGLMAGNLYVNVHTAANPGGEIRGQLRLSAGAHFTATLSQSQENPPTGAPATGTGSFTLTDEGLHYKITVNGLSGAITGAHIHTGGIGINGGVTFDIGATFSGNTAVGLVTGLTAAQKKEMLAGNMYVNVHTALNPGGEIRGQLVPAGGMALGGPMDGAQETPPLAVAGLGTVSATLTPLGLLVDLSANGLTGAITGAHFHNAPSGVPGGVVRTITAAEFVSATSATILWRYDDAEPLTPALLSELLKGNIYVNLHTAANPAGEIRGQLKLAQASNPAAASFTANLTGAQEEPPIAAAGLGTGNFALTPAGLAFRVTVQGLTGAISAAHFHLGAIGIGGGVVRGVAAGEFLSPTTMAGTWTPADASPLTPALVTELIRGNLYFNVHTAANPGGEIRGQVLPASGAEFEARLTGAQETPPLGVVGVGSASFTLTQQGLLFNITYDGLTGAATAAHIHLGAPGVPGGVVRAFAAGEMVTPNTISGVWKPTDAAALTPALMTDLLKGNLYVNVHTVANPGGEIRGQITLSGGDGRDARLMGAQEVPAVSTPAMGTASMTFTDQGLVFRLSANGLSGPLTGAHFHEGAIGVPGPPVRDILGEFTALTGDGVWKPTDAAALTPALEGSLVQNNVYVNLHTAANPGGEIRGQVGVRTTVDVGPPAGGSPALDLNLAPNPIKGQGILRFHLPHAAQVRLTVHDLSGALVARLSDGPREAGWHRVAFDASGMRSGMYFSLLRVGAATTARKLLVVR